MECDRQGSMLCEPAGLQPEPAGLRFVSLMACFQELLIECLSTRSTFISAQNDMLDDSMDDEVKVPAEAAKAWIRALFCTPDQLKSLDNSTLLQCLKASEFFQDSYLVHSVCSILGRRIFKPHADALSLHSAAIHEDNPVEVLEQLPTDLAMEVLRNTPTSLVKQLRQLPSSLRSLAALAHFPALAASCMLPSECPVAVSGELPMVTLCIDTHADVADDETVEAASFHTVSSEHDGETDDDIDLPDSNMWVRVDDESDVIEGGSACCLEVRNSTVACPLVVRSKSLQDVTIKLPEHACLLVGCSSVPMDVQRCTFEGGSVVCLGSSCSAEFHQTIFDSCTLVVASGASAKLQTPQFFGETGLSTSRLSMFAHGNGSMMHVTGGKISGGSFGVAVQDGARLDALGLSLIRVGLVGIEVTDIGSAVSISDGRMDEFDIVEASGEARCGVVVQSGGHADLSSVNIVGPGLSRGVHVHDGSAASLKDCQIRETSGECVLIENGSTAELHDTSLNGSEDDVGLKISGAGTNVKATTCHIDGNCEGGVEVCRSARLEASGCSTSLNCGAGYRCVHEGSRMELVGCSSTEDHYGCQLAGGGFMHASNVDVLESEISGFLVSYNDNGGAVIKECSAIGCGRVGMIFSGKSPDRDSALVEGCQVSKNGYGGIVAGCQAVVSVKNCRSMRNGHEGYKARTGAHITVTDSSSDGDTGGCVIGEGGSMTLHDVMVDGVLESGSLPDENAVPAGEA